jgi:hypothetical protein
MDIAVWNRANGKIVGDTGDDLMGLLQDPDKLLRSNVLRDARKGLQPLSCRHLMACFPEVFLRKNSGFDVLLGNPPWEKVHFEEPQFWSKYINGYYAMSPAERLKAEANIKSSIKDIKEQLAEMHLTSEKRSVIYGNLYSDPKGGNVRYGAASGHPDLFRMFAWRFWELLRVKGRVGIVLPRTAFSGDVMSAWRNRLVRPESGISRASLSITVLANKAGWVFDDIDTRYTVCLCTIFKEDGVNSLKLNGPFEEINRFSRERASHAEFSAEEVSAWTDSCKLPLLPSTKAQELFRKIRKQPNLVGENDVSLKWRCRPIQELNSTSNKDLFNLKDNQGETDFMPVYKGESFDLWNPDRGGDRYYGRVNSNQETMDELYRKRIASFRRGGSSPWAGAEINNMSDIGTIECLFPRIAFRDITNRTNTRTLVASLLPPGVVCTHKAPVLVWPKGSDADKAYLIGILSSRVCDWYVRRWVEMTMSFTIFNTIPCPRPEESDALWAEMVKTAGRLACPDKRFSKWAKSVGVDHGPLKLDEKQELIDRVDAVAALLYDLSEQELETVFETFHDGWDWKPDHARVLAEYRRLKTKHKI